MQRQTRTAENASAHNSNNQEVRNSSIKGFNGKSPIQGYFIGQATLTTDASALHGQDRQADNSFRDPADLNSLAVSDKNPTAHNSLKISEDGLIAIENVDGDRQAKVFFADSKVIEKSNKQLLKVGSKYILKVKQTRVLALMAANGKTQILDAVEPVVNPDTGKKSTPKKVAARVPAMPSGDNVNVSATCIAVAEAIINAKYGVGGTASLKLSASKMGLKTPIEQTQWGACVAEAMTLGGKRKSGAVNQDAIARAYGLFLQANPVGAAKVAKKLGINEFANPKVGEAFISESVGMPGAAGIQNWLVDPTGATSTDLMTADASVRGGQKRTGWGNHMGAVVAESAGNKITLENYARSGEDDGLVDTDPIFYFAMYGPASNPAQTWHAVWSSGAAPIANAVTATVQRKTPESEPVIAAPIQRSVGNSESSTTSTESPEIPANVNVHTESSKATDMGALAFAQGTDVHFAPGQYQPDTTEGQKLIGHELHHVKQQAEGRVKATAQLKGKKHK